MADHAVLRDSLRMLWKRLRADYLALCVLMLSMSMVEEPLSIQHTLVAGAQGCILVAALLPT